MFIGQQALQSHITALYLVAAELHHVSLTPAKLSSCLSRAVYSWLPSVLSLIICWIFCRASCTIKFPFFATAEVFIFAIICLDSFSPYHLSGFT